jgi:hypothetical protein
MSLIRRGAILAAMALQLPAELSALWLPFPRRRGPTRPAPLPPQVEPVARNLAYKRMRLSVESYPLVSFIRAPELNGPGSGGWTSFGTGTHADYRLTRRTSLTLDLTSSFAGGLVDVHTAELGTRLRPELTDRRLYPFVDLRVGYVLSSRGFYDPISEDFGFPTSPSGSAFRYSEGFGAVAGAGAEYTLTRKISVTAAAAVMRSFLTVKDLVGSGPNERSYDMTLYRYTLGIRYNPGRWVRVPGSDMY